MKYIEGWGGCVCPTSLWTLTRPPWQEQGTDSHCRIIERGVSNQLPRLPYWHLLDKSGRSAPTPLDCAAERGGKNGEKRRANKPCFQTPKSILLLLDILIPGVSWGTECVTSLSIIAAGWRWRLRPPLGSTDTTLAKQLHCLAPLCGAQISCPCGPANAMVWGSGSTASFCHAQDRSASHSALLTPPCGVLGACCLLPPR